MVMQLQRKTDNLKFEQRFKQGVKVGERPFRPDYLQKNV